MFLLGPQKRDLEMLERRTRLRRLVSRKGLDFSSNDYLALAGSAELRWSIVDALSRGVPVGSGGSRLLRGNEDEHEALEKEAAAFFGSESSLYFSSGFAANAVLLSALPQRGDRIFADELIHASCHEGMSLSRADRELVRHNDPEAFGKAIAAWRKLGGTGRPWIVVESLYSMDGDRAPLEDLLALALETEALLIIDEAHATGVFGPGGRGLAHGLQGHEQVIAVRTCGKALGAEGALVCGPRLVREFLINRGRGFIFSTAPSPLMAAAVRSALHLIREGDRQERLKSLMAHAGKVLGGVGVPSSGSQIMPLIIGEDADTMGMAAELQAAGFDVRGIRPPTVPAGTSRLRISLTLNVTQADVEALAAAIGKLRK